MRPMSRRTAYSTRPPSSCRSIFIMFRLAFMKMYTSPLRRLAHIPLVTMPLSPLKLLRISTGLLYSQYLTLPSRLNIARRYYLAQVCRGHVSLDAHRRTAGRTDLHCQKAFLVLWLLLFAFRLLGWRGLDWSRSGHHRDEPGWNQRLFVLIAIPALPPVVLMLGYSVAFQIVLLTDVLLFAFPVDRGNLFSCHHKISIFCKSSEDLSPLQYAFRRMLTHRRQRWICQVSRAPSS